MKEGVNAANMIKQQKVYRPQGGAGSIKAFEEKTEVMEDRFWSSRSSGREKDQSRISPLTQYFNHLVRVSMISSFHLPVSNDHIHQGRFKKVLMVLSSFHGQWNQDNSEINQSEEGENGGGIKVSDQGDYIS